MHCPTCSSPLPDGAMFCGQCGRAISSADWAAFRRERESREEGLAEPVSSAPAGGSAPGTARENVDVDADESAAADADAGAAWSLRRPPAAAVPAGTPWWVADGSAEPTGERAVEQDPDERAHPEAAPEPAADDTPDEETIASVRAAAPAPTAPPAVPTAPPAAAEAPALRPPGAFFGTGTGTGRPTSVPLWTASLTPITDSEREADAAEREADAVEPETSKPETAEASTAAPLAVPDADADADTDADARAADAASPVEQAEPQPGDTNVIPPLVAPGAVLSDGRLHCTVCGAPLADDDIFCGECGTVVQSVAQSFTGPITPILTGVVPPQGAPAASTTTTSADGQDDASNTGSAETEADPAPAVSLPRPAPLAPTPVVAEPALPPFVAEPEKPKVKKRRLFGRRAAQEAPKLWSAPAATDAEARPEASSAQGPVPPMPPSDESAPEPAASSGASAAAPPVRADQVPAPSVDEHPEPAAPRPLAATPVEAEAERADPVVAPLPPAPVVDRPAAPWAINLGAPSDDVESTRIVRRQPLGEPFVLQFSTGESFTVQGTGLVGRAPTPQPGEAIDLLVRIVDPGRSVSKTHLEFGQDDGVLWVSDRWSGNGSVVRPPSEQARRVEPGKRVRVPRGSRVEIGEQFFIVN